MITGAGAYRVVPTETIKRTARTIMILVALAAASIAGNLALTIKLIGSRHAFRKVTDPAVQQFVVNMSSNPYRTFTR